ncbi:MAG: Inner membrane protein YbjJ [Candidatus Erwinia impunctatus]|nr:Inner membrane protein YbjJ [Culicoides impunctatus]
MDISAAKQIDTAGKRHATRLIFFIAGLIMGLWAALIPYAQQRTAVDAGELGLLLPCLGAGSLVSMSAAGRWIGQAGCRLVIVASAVTYCVMLPLLASISTPLLLALVLFIFGVGVGLYDVAMNVQGSLVEQASGEPLMSGFHFFLESGRDSRCGKLCTAVQPGTDPTAKRLAGYAGDYHSNSTFITCTAPFW